MWPIHIKYRPAADSVFSATAILGLMLLLRKNEHDGFWGIQILNVGEREPWCWTGNWYWCMQEHHLDQVKNDHICLQHFFLSIMLSVRTVLHISTHAHTHQRVHMTKNKLSRRSTALRQNTKIPHKYFTCLDLCWCLCLRERKWEFYSVCLSWVEIIAGHDIDLVTSFLIKDPNLCSYRCTSWDAYLC